ncbi:hypothetical protein [Stigmatella aurantiaca]|uniref:Conserved uncharacterized protein n=1 Tax=Stigmatella aurantiaca (strain DW4/3-1) TaxID=378806 RepID=E3FVB8_STIAD|nr:hypothetical protein [Stigmatella aurantiaca]ADO70944.1 conserved uncharacterized protein [Stigmatella aurantiaca DW4/3-1]
MKRPLLTLAWTLLASTGAAAAPKSTLRYSPPPDQERPVIIDATVGPQGSDFAMRLLFNKDPWGDACKNRCANATLFLDTDSSTSTGIQLGKGVPETGADLAVIVQGVREYLDNRADTFLRVKVRQLSDNAQSVDDGEALADLNHRQDPERVQFEDRTVYLLIDATSTTLPSGRKVRVIYHPPGSKAIQGTLAGMLSGGSSGSVRIFRGGSSKNAAPKAGGSARPSNSSGAFQEEQPLRSQPVSSGTGDNG